MAVEFFDPRVTDIQDEFIFFRRLISLKKDDSGSGLKGKWEINHWAATVDENSDKKFSSGPATEVFGFLPVSADSGSAGIRKSIISALHLLMKIPCTIIFQNNFALASTRL